MLLLSLLSTLACAADTHMGRSLAPTMHHLGAPWLERNTRQNEEDPAALIDGLELAEGMVACDIGAGSGYHALRMSRRVGDSGTVYAIDIQPEMLALVQAGAERSGMTNVETVQNSQTQTGLPPESCDVILLVDVYHELSEPSAMLESMLQALRVDGALVIVEFRAEDPRVPIKPLHKMSKAQVMKELTASGYKLVSELNTLPWQHAMFFQRADGPDPAIEPAPWP
ncbi:MAG: ubiquinone/menaquinone biosynthesis C-methylase UbiE [Myxococcota bacterium]|jgi:ubiquinone/menaquinone biosynthesis C-methylase UbiE